MYTYVHVSALVIYFIDQMKFLFQLLILISTSVHVGPKEMYEIYFCEFWLKINYPVLSDYRSLQFI